MRYLKRNYFKEACFQEFYREEIDVYKVKT